MRGGKATTSSQVVTPLRQARLAIPATLEDVCADLDQHAVDGSAGVTPSMLSGWELGRHVTSIRYRKLLADYYGQPPEVLFAHQDASLASTEESPRLLVGYRDLREAMTAVVDGARRYLAVSGSRSRDTTYLAAIESVLAARPELVHYRVLFGPPRHAVLADHLLRLLDLRDPADRSLGKTLHVGMVVEDPSTPERFFCAPFGDENAWTHPPTSGVVEDGWMWGRGSSDSKAAVAIFCHLATRLAASTEQLHGSLVLLFDLDEHTGRFGGATRYFQGPNAPDDVAGVMIGYPGMDKLVIGGRGFYRAQLHVHGTASHSGGSKPSPNAIDKAAHLIRELAAADLPDGASEDFPLPGKVTVTAIEGGQGYSVTPDLCTLNIDIRTTPTFTDAAASTLLNHVTTHVDQRWPDTRPTLVQLTTRWPAYALPADSRLRTTLLRVAHAFGVDVEPKIAGPSNIGNYLAGLGIPATAGFGVAYTGLHATDERIRLDTIPTIQAVYHATLLSLLTSDPDV